MKFEWNDEMQEALGVTCLLAHKYRVDITITFTHNGDVEVKAEPTYWDKDIAETPQEERRDR